MSIENIKELFCKRVQESDSCNLLSESSEKKDLPPEDGDNEEEEMESGEEEGEENQITGVREIDAGITEYLTNVKGFNAVIKQRFNDFHVHEIDKEGNVVTLTNNKIPDVPIQPIKLEVITHETWSELDKLDNKLVESVEIDVTGVNKEGRKEIHRAIKCKYGARFKSNTMEYGDKKMLVISIGKEPRRNEFRYVELGHYLYFVLYKRNLDTIDAINILASKLRTNPCNITYAGTKDKRANTSQWVCMWHWDAQRVDEISDSLRGIRIGNYTYKDNQLKLGDLQGNMFEIALRNVTENDEVVNTALNTLKQKGFINYFGLQRFGNCSEVPTYEIGRALVRKDFKRAVELILKPRNGRMRNDLKMARRVWWQTRDAVQALKCLKSSEKTIEGKLLHGLAKHGPRAYVNALDCIPRNVRLLYLHAYQSVLWNKILSRRIKEFGTGVIEGDLVFIKPDEEMNEEVVKPADRGNTLPSSCIVRAITIDEITDYKITDIIHPLPGYSIVYPNNLIKEWYEELLKEDNLTSEKFKHSVRKYSLSGTYRYIVKNVKDLSWHTCHYSDPEEDLILSDYDKMEGRELDINRNYDSKYKAVILKFTLDSSTYATMALRELLKIDTSCSYQASLNSYSNKRTSQLNEGDDLRKKVKMN